MLRYPTYLDSTYPDRKFKNKNILMIINLDLNIMESNDEEAYNQEYDLSKIFYYKLNKIDDFVYNRDNEDYDNNGDFENLYNEYNNNKSFSNWNYK